MKQIVCWALWTLAAVTVSRALAEEAILERGPHTEIHQKIVPFVEDGETKYATNTYTEFRSGLNYFSAGENDWKRSSTQIDLVQDGATFTKGPFKLTFAPNYNRPNGAVALTLPDGRLAKIHTVGLALTDLTTGDSFWLGEIRDCNGALDGNKIIYADAFNGVKADIVVTVSVGKVESDVILREQIVTAQTLGLDPAKCRLEIWHKLLDLPEPQSTVHQIQRINGAADSDELLDFGDMVMGEGSAFLVGTNRLPVSASRGAIPVAKERFHDPDTQIKYLIESVPYAEAIAHLQLLPQRQQAMYKPDSLKRKLESARALAAKGVRKRPISLADAMEPGPAAEQKERKIASIAAGTVSTDAGFVMDYTILSATPNFRFKGNETYYVTGTANLTGTTMLEGGTVIKFPPYNSASPVQFIVNGPLTCLTAPYAPAVFTADADKSIGQEISASALSGYYGDFNLKVPSSNPNTMDIHDIQTRHSQHGLLVANTGTHNIANVQAINCNYGIESAGNTLNVCNVLGFNNVSLFRGDGSTIKAEHVTAHLGNSLFTYLAASALSITNSLVVGMTSASANVAAQATEFLSSDTGVFKTVGTGAHYLADKSGFRNSGQPVSDTTRAILKKLTTYPPIELTDNIYKSRTLAPQAQLDIDAPDLGYHYTALDYTVNALAIANATLTLTNGVAIGWHGKSAFHFMPDSKLISLGTPERMNQIIRAALVQDQPTIWPGDTVLMTSILTMTNVTTWASRPDIQVKFTQMVVPGYPSGNRYLVNGGPTKNILIENSQLRNINFFYGGGQETLSHSVSLINSIFERCSISFDRYYAPNFVFNLWNNLFTYSSVSFGENPGTSGAFSYIRDNVFDTVATSLTGPQVLHDHNAYYATTTLPYFSSANGVNVQLTAVNFVPSYLGRFYSPGTGGLAALINAGSRAASTAKLFHFTSLSSQVKETNSTVDIGFHYVACNTDGAILDSDRDGLADIFEDTNLDGTLGATETDVLNSDTDGDGWTDGEEKKNGMNARVADAGQPRRLAYWSFSNPDLDADTGQVCVDKSGTTAEIPGAPNGPFPCFLGNAAHVTTSTSRLAYDEIGKDGKPILDRRKGSISLWFRPEWTRGSNPFSNWAPLFSLGSSATTNNWWSFDISPAGDAIRFISQTGAAPVVHFTWTMDQWWNQAKWHHIVLTYDATVANPTNELWIDAVKRVSLAGGPFSPAPSIRLAEKLYIGNTKVGTSGVKGHFDDIEIFNYAFGTNEVYGAFHNAADRDDDNDGLSNLFEIDTVGSNPLLVDSDQDGMPDGWEYRWSRFDPSPGSHRLSPTQGGEADLNYDGDDYTNIEEFRLSLNPWRVDHEPKPIEDNIAAAATSLINIDFGPADEPAAVGPAAAGTYNAGGFVDQWNKIGPSSPNFGTTHVPLTFADGVTPSGVSISLIMDLGHATQFTLDCVTNGGPGANFCTWLTGTNSLLHNVFCCTNLTEGDPNQEARFYCLQSDTGESMYMHEEQYGPEIWSAQPHPHRYTKLWRMLVPSWPWSSPFGNLAPAEAVYNFFNSGYAADGTPLLDPAEFRPTTTLLTFWTPAVYFQRVGSGNPSPPPDFDYRNVRAMGTMEHATIAGFDLSGVVATEPTTSPLHDYLANSWDGMLTSQPQQPDCGSQWFTGDGHGAIEVTGLKWGEYCVYLYGAGPAASLVNEIVAVGDFGSFQVFDRTKMGYPGQHLQNYTSGANYIAFPVKNIPGFRIEFKQGASLISGMQILRVPENPDWAMNAVTATFDKANGIKVNWLPTPGFNYRVYRLVKNATGVFASPERLIDDKTSACTIYDRAFPSGYTISYRVAAIDPFGIERASRFSGDVDPSSINGWSTENHGPSLHYVTTLKHTFKQTPYVVSATRIQASSDAWDFEGNPIFFDITKVLTGTISVTSAETGATEVYTPESTFPDELPRIGPKTTVTWTPGPLDFGRTVHAFCIRATDGALSSGETVEVSVEVRDTSALLWWGSWTYGWLGTGDPMREPNMTGYQFWRAKTSQQDLWTTDPAFVLVDQSQVAPGMDRRLQNVVQIAANNRWSSLTRAVLKADGTVWTWGRGDYGTLGDDRWYNPSGFPSTASTPPLRYMTKEALMPIRVVNLNGVQQIAAGQFHMLAVKSDGSVWGWGCADSGALGVPPESVTLMANGAYSWGEPPSSEIHATSRAFQLPMLQNVVSVAAGGSSSLAITAEGELFWWGEWDQIKHGKSPSIEYQEQSDAPIRIEVPGKVMKAFVDPDGSSFFAVNDRGEVWGWGSNDGFMLGATLSDPQYRSRSSLVKVPIGDVITMAVGPGHCLAVLRDGTVWQWGGKIGPRGKVTGGPEPVRGLRNIVAVSTTGAAALAVNTEGQVFGWGSADDGTIGQRKVISRADWDLLYSLEAPERRAEREEMEATPRFGYYPYPVPLDALDWAQEIAAVSDGGLAVASLSNGGPRAFAAEARDGSVLLTWKRVAGATAYEIQRKETESESGVWVTIASIADDPSTTRQQFVDGSVMNGSHYWYQVAAIVAGQKTSFSVTAEAVPDALPPAVSLPNGESLSHAAHIYWSCINRARSYEIWRAVGNGQSQYLTNLTADAGRQVTLCSGQVLNGTMEAFDIRLAAGVACKYKIRAINDVGAGPFSQEVTITPTQNPATTVLPNLTWGFTSTEAHFDWTPENGAEYFVTISQHRFGTTAGGTTQLQPGPERFVKHLLAGDPGSIQLELSPGDKHDVRIYKFMRCDGTSPAGEWAPYLQQNIDAPAEANLPPITLSVTAGVKGFYARWHGSAERYSVSLTKNNTRFESCFPLVEPDDNGNAEYYQTELDPGDYTLRVDQFTSDYGGSSANAAEVNVHIDDGTVDPLPEVVVQKADSRLRVTWWGPDDSQAWNVKAAYQGYRFILQRLDDPTAVCKMWKFAYDGPDLGVQDEEVVNGQSYTYRVYAISPDLSVRMRDSAPAQPGPSFDPAVAFSLQAVAANGAVQLSWNQIGTPGEADEYEIQGSATPGATQPVIAVVQATGLASYTYVDLNVRNGTTNYYQVVAHKANGDAAMSNQASARPSEDEDIVAPTAIVSQAFNQNMLLYWRESPGAGYYMVTATQGVAPSPVSLQTKTPWASVRLKASANGTFNQNDFTLQARRRSAVAPATPLAYTALAWGDPSLSGENVENFRIFRTVAGVTTEIIVDKTLHDWGEITPSGATYDVKAKIENNSTLRVVRSAIPTPQTISSSEVAIRLGDLPTSVTTPTNLLLTVVVDTLTIGIKEMQAAQFYSDNVLIGSDSTYPFEFNWVNPPGAISGSGASHSIKARLIDTQGRVADTATKTINVKLVPPLQKFETSITDLQIPAPGMPLAITRLYDSQNLSAGMLGKGWKFDWEDTKMVVPDLANGWIPGYFSSWYNYNLQEATPHQIEVRLPGNVVQRFHPMSDGTIADLDLDDTPDDVKVYFNLRFAPLSGSYGHLTEPLGFTSVWTPGWNPGSTVNDEDNRPFRPRSLNFVDDSGARLAFATSSEITSFPYTLPLKSITSKLGIQVQWNESTTTAGDLEIHHSNGKSIFVQKYTPPGNVGYWWYVYDPISPPASGVPAVKYFVDSNSFLREVHALKDRTAPVSYTVTKYSYVANRLAQVINNDGIVVLTNSYDASGFLTQQSDSMGLTKTLAPDANSLTVTVGDNAGSVTPQAIYGPGGELVGVRKDSANPNSVVNIGYDGQGRVAFQKSEDDAYTSYEYDGQGNVTSITDPDGNQTGALYTPSGEPAMTFDGQGHSTRYDYYGAPIINAPPDLSTEYNPEGSLRSVTDPEGNATFYTYNRWGQTLTEKKTQGRGGLEALTRYVYAEVDDPANGKWKGDLLQVIEPRPTVDDPECYVTTYTYDANGNRATETRKRRDRFGQLQTIQTTMYYDGQNRVVRTTNPLNEDARVVFDGNGKALQSFDALGQVTGNLYDPRGNLIETTYPDSTVSRTVFDAKGRVIWTQERCVRSGTGNLDTVGPATETVYDSLGRVSVVRRRENTTIHQTEVTPVDEGAACALNTNYRRVVGATTPLQYRMDVTVAGNIASSTRTIYDAAGRVQYSIDELGGLTQFAYDKAGRRTSVKRFLSYTISNPETWAPVVNVDPPTTATFAETTYGYDANGNQAWVEDGNHHRTDFEYDWLNRQRVVIYPQVTGDSYRKRTVTDYDGFGRRVQELDEQGIATAFGYDVWGRLTSVTNDFKPLYNLGETPAVTRYEYDEVGNLRKELRLTYDLNESGNFAQPPNPTLTENASRTTVYEYDLLSRRTHRFLPGAASLDDVTPNGSMEKVSYAKVGTGPYTLRKTVRDFRGITITNDFDSMDRLRSKALPAVNSGEVLRTVSYDYTGALLTTVRENGTGLARTNYYHYDDSRRLRRKDTPEGVLAYTYAPNNAVTTLRGFARSVILPIDTDVMTQTPSSNVGYSYDAVGRLSTVTNYSVGSGLTTYSYDAVGNLTETAYPANRITNTFDARNRLTSIRIGQTNGTLLRKFDYAYTAASLRASVTESHLDGATAVQRRRVAYRYDEGVADLDQVTRAPARFNRLTQEDIIEGGGTAPTAGESFLYDLVGNRRIQNASNVPGVAGSTFEYNALDQFDTGYDYNFDANGNTIASPGGTTDYYDTENRLVKRVQGTTTITMGYDPDGNRVWRHLNANGTHTTIYFLVDDKNPTGYPQIVAQFKDTAASPAPVTATFNGLYEWGHKLISFKQGGTNYWAGADALGSIRFVMLANGSTLSGHDYDYDAYGNLISNPGAAIDLPIRYANYEWDSTIGMAHTGPRYYDTKTGRFWQRDSYEGSANDPISLHKYLYCSADPINRIDPTGHMNMVSLMSATSTIGFIASNTYIRFSYAINRAVVVVYEAASGEMVILGRGTAVGAEVALSKVEGGIGTWVKAVGEIGKNSVVGPYAYMKELLKSSGWQANHLNQSAAYKAIKQELGAAIDLVGNAFTQGTEHNSFHQVMEAFWAPFRRGGPRFRDVIPNKEYLAALRQALESVKTTGTNVAKYTKRQIDALVELAEKEQRGYGYHDGAGGLHPEPPASMNLN